MYTNKNTSHGFLPFGASQVCKAVQIPEFRWTPFWQVVHTLRFLYTHKLLLLEFIKVAEVFLWEMVLWMGPRKSLHLLCKLWNLYIFFWSNISSVLISVPSSSHTSSTEKPFWVMKSTATEVSLLQVSCFCKTIIITIIIIIICLFLPPDFFLGGDVRGEHAEVVMIFLFTMHHIFLWTCTLALTSVNWRQRHFLSSQL